MSVEIHNELPVDLNREYTAEEFVRLEDDGNRYELIEGKLVMSPPPEFGHGRISDKLLRRLGNYLEANPGIGEAVTHVGFNLGKKPNDKDNILEPDLGFIVAGRVPATDQGYPSYPDLAVEVWSSQSDLGDANKLKKARAKLQIYLKAGTRIAWGINPEKLEVEVYYKDPARPTKVLSLWNELDGEDLIPGFRLSLKDLFGR